MTKTNLTLLTIGLVAVSLLASCKKNDNDGTADGQGFKASIEQSSESRTHGEVGVNDNVVNVKWTAADQILVANNADNAGTTTTLTYELTEGENTGDGIFYTGQPHDDFFHPNYAAIYPNVNPDGTANSLSRTTATFNLPATQAYAGSNLFAEKVVPMVAYSTSQTLQFKNACGGLRFPMVGSNVTVQRVVLTTTNTSDHLNGVFTVDCSSSNPTLAWQSGGGNTITIDCGSGITLGTTPTYFYFMLPPGTLHGLRLTAYDGSSNVVYSVESSRDYLIERNKIKKVDTNLEIPLEVTTASPTYITATSAKGGVSVANGTATETGICWGTSNAPDITGSHIQGTTAISMTGLSPNTIYYVRAYAISAKGTCYYGEAIPFASRGDYASNGGKLPGLFSVSGSEQCHFSMGNLQYQASSNTWRYARRQFDYVGYEHQDGSSLQRWGTVVDNGVKSNNDLVSNMYAGWVDVFQWGASNNNHNNHVYQPWMRHSHVNSAYVNTDPANNYAYNNATFDLNSSDGRADWGYNNISNGSSIAWPNKFTPSSTQMDYLLYQRTGTALGGQNTARFAFTRIIVNDTTIRGIMLFPDVFTWPSDVSIPNHINDNNNDTQFPGAWYPTSGDDFTNYDEREWSLLEHAGMVFLPCAGCWAVASEMDNWGNYGGRYWLSDHVNGTHAYEFAFSPQHSPSANGEGIVNPKGKTQRTIGFAVRLLIK